ncbi:S1 domain-containing protein [Flavobacterium degerlachei]|jgi:hypothetical protein|uniref:'Cold-shock' DNA-binding domain-containing protein n=1 Tax=Flavobacterium degerlachei TaxID=229203 RepID=A0A1H3D1E0_9FLAO|nr:cold shock domain-containing protein [Flavobacterium degerlachei]SDX59499.1 'Cold-shock' DNA-binding domain-containing protein [Flavobacterium degerlachei]
MKGIIIDYIQEKGFGFIKDENENRCFFHISQFREKEKFLNNVTNYLYTDWVDRNRFVIDFKVIETEKGFNAIDISMTNQIFNDKSIKDVYKVKIIDLKYDTTSLTRTVSGIKNGMSVPFGATDGGNGTYRIGYPEVLRELNIYFRRIDDIGWGTIEIRELALRVNDRNKITDKLIENLKNKIVGKAINIVSYKGDWKIIDNSILEI